MRLLRLSTASYRCQPSCHDCPPVSKLQIMSLQACEPCLALQVHVWVLPAVMPARPAVLCYHRSTVRTSVSTHAGIAGHCSRDAGDDKHNNGSNPCRSFSACCWISQLAIWLGYSAWTRMSAYPWNKSSCSLWRNWFGAVLEIVSALSWPSRYGSVSLHARHVCAQPTLFLFWPSMCRPDFVCKHH